VDTVIGTTAPFSAISGAFIFMSPLAEWLAVPYSEFSASSTFLAAKADSGHAANTARGESIPALTATPTMLVANVPFKKFLRFMLTVLLWAIKS
jgi:hypothetical protein